MIQSGCFFHKEKTNLWPSVRHWWDTVNWKTDKNFKTFKRKFVQLTEFMIISNNSWQQLPVHLNCVSCDLKVAHNFDTKTSTSNCNSAAVYLHCSWGLGCCLSAWLGNTRVKWGNVFCCTLSELSLDGCCAVEFMMLCYHQLHDCAAVMMYMNQEHSSSPSLICKLTTQTTDQIVVCTEWSIVFPWHFVYSNFIEACLLFSIYTVCISNRCQSSISTCLTHHNGSVLFLQGVPDVQSSTNKSI